MAYQKTTVVRGVTVELKNARLELPKGLIITSTQKKRIAFSLFTPSVATDVDSGEVKFKGSAWEEQADKLVALAKANKNGRFNVKGYMKLANPWTTPEGKVVVGNDFVITSIDPVKAANTSVVSSVDEDEDPSDTIPF